MSVKCFATVANHCIFSVLYYVDGSWSSAALTIRDLHKLYDLISAYYWKTEVLTLSVILLFAKVPSSSRSTFLSVIHTFLRKSLKKVWAVLIIYFLACSFIPVAVSLSTLSRLLWLAFLLWWITPVWSWINSKYRVESDSIRGGWHPGHPLHETPTFDQRLLWLTFQKTDPHNCWPKIALAYLPAKVIVSRLTFGSPALWNSNIWSKTKQLKD
jgi:hypothetical protein